MAKVTIGQADWEKINTAISKAVETAIAPLRPVSPWSRPMEFLRRWGAIAILWTVPLALVALAASALYAAVARVRAEATFETNTSRDLLDLKVAIEKLQNQQNTAILRPGSGATPAAIAEAATELIHNKAKLPRTDVALTAQPLLAEAYKDAAAWKATTALLNYASFLAPEPSVTGPRTPIPAEPPNMTTMFALNWAVGKEGTGSTVGIAHSPNLPEAHPLGSPDLNAHLEVGPAFLVEDGAIVHLDDTFIKNTVFENTQIYYDGGPVVLENVYFVNCTFILKQTSHALDLAKSVFQANPSVSLATKT